MPSFFYEVNLSSNKTKRNILGTSIPGTEETYALIVKKQALESRGSDSEGPGKRQAVVAIYQVGAWV